MTPVHCFASWLPTEPQTRTTGVMSELPLLVKIPGHGHSMFQPWHTWALASIDKKTNKQTNKHTQTHRHTDTQTHRHTDTQTHRHTDTQTHRHTDTQTHRHTDTQTHRHTDTQTHRHTHTHTHTHTHRHMPLVQQDMQLRPPVCVCVWVGGCPNRANPQNRCPLKQTNKHTQTHRHTDTQTHRHTDTQTHRHTDTQTHRHTDTQTHRHTDTQTHRHTDTHTHSHTHTHTPTHATGPARHATPTPCVCVWVGGCPNRANPQNRCPLKQTNTHKLTTGKALPQTA